LIDQLLRLLGRKDASGGREIVRFVSFALEQHDDIANLSKLPPVL
jgi:hypothetical protein